MLALIGLGTCIGLLLTPLGMLYQDVGRDRFDAGTPNPVKVAAEEPVSTFSVDVDTAAYAFARRELTGGVLPQKAAVRIEEFVNYFDYDYPVPASRDTPFRPTVVAYPTPWNPATRLVQIGIQGYVLAPAQRPRANLVFLIDKRGRRKTRNSPQGLKPYPKGRGKAKCPQNQIHPSSGGLQ